MKRQLSVLALALLTTVDGGRAASSAFMVQVNSAWQAQNYDLILQLGSSESTNAPSDPEAFAVLYEYDLIVARNDKAALQELKQLIGVLQTAHPGAVSAVQGYCDRLSSLPTSDGSPLNAQQMNQLHLLFPADFPVAALLNIIAAN